MTSHRVLPISEAVESVTAEDGYRLSYRVWAGPSSPQATLVVLSGVMSHSGWFRTIAEPMASMNLRIVGADRRGSGLNLTNRGDAISPEQLLRDLKLIIEREHASGSPLYLVGWCWGAVVAVNAALELGPTVAGIVLLAPGLFPSEQLRDAMQSQRVALNGTPIDAPCLASPISEEMFTTGPWLDSFILKDDLRLRAFTPRFYRIMVRMGIIAAARLDRLSQPVLVILARKDLAVDNRRTTRALQGVTRTVVTIAACDCHHGMQFEAPQEVATQIISWLNRQTPVRTLSGRLGAQ